jgi:hypothetical protein
MDTENNSDGDEQLFLSHLSKKNKKLLDEFIKKTLGDAESGYILDKDQWKERSAPSVPESRVISVRFPLDVPVGTRVRVFYEV